jgi:hypothetical protein
MNPFYHRWLMIWCWITLGFGVLMVGAAFPPFDRPALALFDVAFLPFDGKPAAFAAETQFAAGVGGAVMLGWAVLVIGLVQRAAVVSDPVVWRLLLASMATWCALDCIVSIKTGALGNVSGNVIIFALFLWPVWKSGVLTQPFGALAATRS